MNNHERHGATEQAPARHTIGRRRESVRRLRRSQPAPDARREAYQLWNRHPAGTTLTAAEWRTPEFYEQMRETRYELQPWHPALLRSFRGSRLLEVGCGAGTDLASLTEGFSFVVGVDLTPSGAQLAKGAVAQRGGRGATVVADGVALPFRSSAFDFVYSFGVLHHTAHPETVVGEIERVLEQRGHVVVAVYHRWSVFTLCEALLYIVGREYRSRTWKEFIARIEGGAIEEGLQPRVDLYSRRQARSLLRSFTAVRTRTVHYGVVIHLGQRLENLLSRFLGWYVIVEGDRP